MSHGREFDKPTVYLIRVKGSLDTKWADWFNNLSITPQPQNETLLIGPITDQSALHGILGKIRDLGLPLLSVERLDSSDDELP